MRGFFLVLSAFLLATLMPAVPASAKMPSAADFGTLPAVYDSAISPDGKQVAIFLNYKGGYVAAIFLVDDMKAPPVTVGLGDDTKPRWLSWANNERLLVSIWSSDKIDGVPIKISNLLSLDASTGKSKRMARAKGFRQFGDTVIDMLKDDPDHILMSFSDEDQNKPNINRVNVNTGRSSIVRRGGKGLQYWYTDLRGEPRVGQGVFDTSVEKYKLIIRDADEKGKWRSWTEYPSLHGNSDIIGFTKDPNEMIVRTRRGRDTSGLYIYDLSQKKFTRKLFHNDDYDAGGVVLSADGGEVIGATYVAEKSETTLFDKHDTVLRALRKKYGNYTVRYVDQSKGGAKILFTVSGGSQPSVLKMIDSATMKERTISFYRPELKGHTMGQMVSLRYTARDGQKIPAFVTLPPAVTETAQIKNLPFVILPHGGPYARTQKEFDYFTQFFATRGYGVLEMNFRGSTGYGQKFKDTGRNN